MKNFFFTLLFCIVFLPTIVKGDKNYCTAVSVESVMAYYFSEEFIHHDRSLLLEFSYKRHGEFDKYGDLIVMTEEILRGGSASAAVIHIYKGLPTGVCGMPIMISLSMDPVSPYEMKLLPDKDLPKIDITYKFFDSNYWKDYKTNASYVSDFRNELYSYKDGSYHIEKKKIIKCDICAEKIQKNSQ